MVFSIVQCVRFWEQLVFCGSITELCVTMGVAACCCNDSTARADGQPSAVLVLITLSCVLCVSCADGNADVACGPECVADVLQDPRSLACDGLPVKSEGTAHITSNPENNAIYYEVPEAPAVAPPEHSVPEPSSNCDNGAIASDTPDASDTPPSAAVKPSNGSKGKSKRKRPRELRCAACGTATTKKWRKVRDADGNEAWCVPAVPCTVFCFYLCVTA